MTDRPDKENWDTLQKHGELVSFGKTRVDLIFVNGFLTGWEELFTKRGHKSPLKKEGESIEED